MFWDNWGHFQSSFPRANSTVIISMVSDPCYQDPQSFFSLPQFDVPLPQLCSWSNFAEINYESPCFVENISVTSLGRSHRPPKPPGGCSAGTARNGLWLCPEALPRAVLVFAGALRASCHDAARAFQNVPYGFCFLSPRCSHHALYAQIKKSTSTVLSQYDNRFTEFIDYPNP